MTVLRDISFLWSMLHVVLMFLIFFEPRRSWRTTVILSFAGAGTLLPVNMAAAVVGRYQKEADQASPLDSKSRNKVGELD